MTERIKEIKEYQWEKRHHKARQPLPETLCYRDPGLSDTLRSALRTKQALDAEQPFLFPGEYIAFTRTLPNLPFLYDEGEWADITSTHFIHESGNVSNLSPDYEAVLQHGLLYFRERLGDGELHKATRITIDALLSLTARYAAAAREAGDEELATVLDRVPAQGARTFREALQSLRILHYAMWCEGDYHNTLGRFDQYMMPYLADDLQAGRETEESALELVEAFFLACNRDSDLYPGMQQGDNGQSMVLGGMTRDGADGYNLLTGLCLDACGELMLIDPKINLRVNKNTPLWVYEKGTRLTRLGLGFPQYQNDDVVIPGLVRLGYAEGDARDYAVAACWEFIIPGKGMEIPNIGALPFANIVDEAIRFDLKDCTDMQALKEKVRQRIFDSVAAAMAERKNLYIIPSPFLSLFFEGCMDSGRDISLGCRYNNWGLHGTGLAPAADMLAAVEQKVFEEGLPVDTLLAALEADFVGYEELHESLKYHSPKMGNDEDRVDALACWLLESFAEAVSGHKNERGGILRAGTGSAMYYIFHANELGATADGREAGVPLPANYAPSLNIRLNGPVSLIKSFTKPDLEKTINGGPLTVEFSDRVFAQEESITKVAQLVQLFVLRGGHQIQLNTVNRERLLDAQRHPEKYRNLIVRVWGWSGYFVELDKCYQDHIIQRTQLNV
ncbi:MAG: pyruvate formate-lyase [Clostridiales bacterium]|nr:pyruvate formate lyase family protein [Bacillota bacterium]NLL54400.1 pyruvate formate-lyase [Clostridiales bacterium]